MLEKIYGKYWQTVIDTMLEGLMLVDPDGMLARAIACERFQMIPRRHP